jgi:dTDP-4-dehydrorhamnose 3,5-epimerase
VSFVFLPQAIPEVVLIEPRIHGDERGYFLEVYKESAYASLGVRFVQENQSSSRRGVLRGIHFQRDPKAQGKLVRVTSGEILDVAVDLRVGSPTFAHHVTAVLSEENHRLLYIPPGFGHAFYVQSDMATVIYLTTEEYDPALDAGVLWSDPDLRIPWPDQKPVISKKDAALPSVRQLR